ncbi:unnamed protein product [Symbiodinium sp. CCMP2592]|nr:unnamed protein product [Symbiodinium sp. CCMP2592]
MLAVLVLMTRIDRCRATSRSDASQGACACMYSRRLPSKPWTTHLCDRSFQMALTTELATKVEKLLVAASGGSLVRSMEQVYGLLAEHGLLYQQKVVSSFIGVHPSNRDGCGVSAKHVHELLADLVHLGWSPAEFRGLCVEVSEKERSRVFAWNQELAHNSEGQVPPWTSELQLKFATLAGSHTNQVLRCFLAKTPSQCAQVAENGRLSLSSLQTADPDFHRACVEGATWRIVSHQVPERFPNFCQLAQAAANATGHVARQESELQLCRKIHQEVALQMSRGKTNVNYVDIKDAVLRTKPRSASTVPALFVFTLRYSGGQTAHLLQETEKFVRAHGFQSRMLGSDIFEALNTEMKSRDPGALIRHMMLHFAYGAEDARALTVSDVKKLLSVGIASKRDEATRVFEDCKALCSTHAVNVAVSLKALGYLQMNLIAVLLDKKKYKKHENIQKAAQQCVEEINQAAQLRQHKDASRLKSAGYEVGMHVLRKTDSSTGKIKGMTASEVTLDVEGHDVKVSAESFLKGEWRQVNLKGESVAVEFVGSLPVNSVDFQIAQCKARILDRMTAQEATGAAHYGNLELYLKPSKNVQATKRFEKGELVLIPSTHKIDLKRPGSASSGAVVAGLVDIEGETYEIALSSCLQPLHASKPVLHPFWCMRTSTVSAECNLELFPRNHTSKKFKMDSDAVWNIPMAKSTKVINEGDSLVLWKPSTTPRPDFQVRQGMWARLAVGGMLKDGSKWLVKTKEVDNMLFAQIDKWDPKFVPFVTGKAVQLRKEKDPHHLSIPAFGDFLEFRRQACDRLYNAMIKEAALVAGDAAPEQKTAREEDLYVAGRVVRMRCPAIACNGESMEAREIAAVWSVRDPVIWIELLEENLQYLALFMRRGLVDYLADEGAPSRRRLKLRGEAEKQMVKKAKKSPKKKSRRSRKRKAAASQEDITFTPPPPLLILDLVL